MNNYWDDWSTLEPLMRANGVPLNIGPDLSGLVGTWYRTTMNHWQEEYKLRQTLVEKEVAYLVEHRSVRKAMAEQIEDPNTQAQRLAHQTTAQWFETFKSMLLHQIPMTTLEALLRIMTQSSFTINPPPFQNASEHLYLGLTGTQSAALVIVPMAACEPGGGFQNQGQLFALPVRMELLSKRDPLLEPPEHSPIFRTIRLRPKRQQNHQVYHSLQVDSWRPLTDQGDDWAWRYLALGCQKMGDLLLWAGDPFAPQTDVWPRVG